MYLNLYIYLKIYSYDMCKPRAVILSGSTSIRAIAQLYEEYEGLVSEGELYVIRCSNGERILCRVERIIPYNEFFEKGDAWSEARRKRSPIPVDVSRRYVVAELELLGAIVKGSLSDVARPPEPGDEVYPVDPDELEEICGLTGEEGRIIRFGSLYGYENMPLPLDIQGIPMHIAILGVTGSGKSYTMGYLIELLSKIKVKGEEKAIPMIVVDANGDYLDFFYEYKKGSFRRYKRVYRFVFKNSPALLEPGFKATAISMDLSPFSPREVAELIVVYYSGGELNERQAYGIEMILRNLKEEGYEISELFIDDNLFKRTLISELRKAVEKKEIHSQTGNAIERALRKFKDDMDKYSLIRYKNQVTLGEKFIDELTKPGSASLALIDFSTEGAPGVSLQMKQLIISYLTKLLYNKFTDYKVQGEERVLLLAIEEVQNYCPNLTTYPIGYSLARNNIVNIATQGRKFGLSLCLISQRPTFIDPIALSMVNTFIIHRISAGDLHFVKRAAGSLPQSIEQRLVNLRTGYAVVMGQMNRLRFPVIVSVPKREIEPRVGKIDVLSCL